MRILKRWLIADEKSPPTFPGLKFFYAWGDSVPREISLMLRKIMRLPNVFHNKRMVFWSIYKHCSGWSLFMEKRTEQQTVWQKILSTNICQLSDCDEKQCCRFQNHTLKNYLYYYKWETTILRHKEAK